MKKIIAFFLALVMCFCLFGCESDETEDKEAEKTENVKPTADDGEKETEEETEKETEAETDMDTPLLPGYISYNEYMAIVEKYSG